MALEKKIFVWGVRAFCEGRLHNAASTIARSHCLAFTNNSLCRAKRTHRGPDFQKRCCWWWWQL